MESWTCIENCGACCKFDLNERSELADKLNKEDIALINSMTAKDGWCKNLDRENKKCLIYETRPHFCRVSEFSTSFNGYLKSGDKFLLVSPKDLLQRIIKINNILKIFIFTNFNYLIFN